MKGKHFHRFCAFLVLHVHTAVWKERVFLTTKDHPTKYRPQILDFLEALQRPQQISAIHCRRHRKGDSEVVKGNRLTDTTARQATLQEVGAPSSRGTIGALIPEASLPTPSYTEEQSWVLQNGFQLLPSGWLSQGTVLILPKIYNGKSFKSFHESTHLGRESLATLIDRAF